MDVKATLKQIGNAAKAAAAELGFATAERKHAALIGAAEYVWASRGDIIEANALDMDYGREKGLSAAMLDRLMLDEDRIRNMSMGCGRWLSRKIRLGRCSKSGSAPMAAY